MFGKSYRRSEEADAFEQDWEITATRTIAVIVNMLCLFRNMTI